MKKLENYTIKELHDLIIKQRAEIEDLKYRLKGKPETDKIFEHLICKYYKTNPAELRSKTKQGNVASARMICMIINYHHTHNLKASGLPYDRDH
jgi:chromosomal replication initiation ATPase DnaA